MAQDLENSVYQLINHTMKSFFFTVSAVFFLGTLSYATNGPLQDTTKTSKMAINEKGLSKPSSQVSQTVCPGSDNQPKRKTSAKAKAKAQSSATAEPSK